MHAGSDRGFSTFSFETGLFRAFFTDNIKMNSVEFVNFHARETVQLTRGNLHSGLAQNKTEP